MENWTCVVLKTLGAEYICVVDSPTPVMLAGSKTAEKLIFSLRESTGMGAGRENESDRFCVPHGAMLEVPLWTVTLRM